MLIDYNLLRSFVEVANASSFAEAAERRGITASAISHQIKTLEGQLGVNLFERVGRRSKPTSAARDLLESIESEFHSIDDALHGTRRKQDEVRGKVRLGAPGPFFHFWLRPRIRKLLERYPQLEVQVVAGDSGPVEDRLIEGDIDIALYFGYRHSSSLEKAQIYEEEIVAVASPDYFAKRGMPSCPDELQEHAYVGNSVRLIIPWWVTLFGRAEPVPHCIRCDLEDVSEMIALAKLGLGITVVPTYVLGDALETGELKQITWENVDTSYRKPIWIAWRRGVDDTARYRAMRDAFLDTAVSANQLKAHLA